MSETPPQTRSRTGRRQRVLILATPEQFDAIASPMRLRIVECLHATGPISARELAAHLGRSADGLYHHLRRLLAAQLIREAGIRSEPRHPEQLFDVVAEDIRFPRDELAQPENVARIWRLISSGAERSLRGAMSTHAVRFDGQGRNAALRLETARLTAKEREQVLHHLDAVRAVFDSARREAPFRKARGDLSSLAFLFHPLTEETESA